MKTFVDPSVTTECLVLDVYRTPTGGYEVVEWNYGSVRSNRKVIVQPEPYYLYFKEPVYSSMISTTGVGEWVYL